MQINDLKRIIAANISQLRKSSGLTQLELASKLNYTDKAVSKWERAESIPDIAVLKDIAALFSVSVDYLLCEDHSEEENKSKNYSRQQCRNHRIITAMSSVLVWFIATFIFVNVDLISSTFTNHWLLFVYAVPVTIIVLLVLNCVWGKRRMTFIFVSALVWSILLSIYLSALEHNLWQIFIIGIPAQIIIFLWSGIKPKQK